MLHHHYSLFGLALAATVWFATAATSHAQLQVRMDLDKGLYVSYEPIKVTVTVTNRAGRDIVLGGPGGSSWLTFNVSTDKGDPIAASSRPYAGSQVLKAGRSATRYISLGKVYPLGEPRNYRVQANVYFPGTNQYFSSRAKVFSVTEANAIWQQVVGVPRGKPGAGSYRKYQLLTFRNSRRTSLYVRVTDRGTGRVMATYSLGRFIEVVNPQATVDNENRMHVLFLGAPHMYSHRIIGYDGKPVRTDIYRDEVGAPRLMEGSDGSVTVKGGMLFDPSAPNPAVDGANGTRERVRRLSERPPGLPYIPEQQ